MIIRDGESIIFDRAKEKIIAYEDMYSKIFVVALFIVGGKRQ